MAPTNGDNNKRRRVDANANYVQADNNNAAAARTEGTSIPKGNLLDDVDDDDDRADDGDMGAADQLCYQVNSIVPKEILELLPRLEATESEGSDDADDYDDDDDNGSQYQDEAQRQESEAMANEIIEDMIDNPKDLNVQTASCAELQQLAQENKAVRSTIVDMGAVPLILKAMECNKKSVDLQTAGCGCFRWLALDNEHRSRTIIEKGGVAAVLNALKMHPGDSNLQQNGCRALCNMGCNSAQNKAIIIAEGAIEAVVAAMKQHPDDGELHTTTCVVLSQMVQEPAAADVKSKIKEAGVIEVLQAAIQTHPDIEWLADGVLSKFEEDATYVDDYARAHRTVHDVPLDFQACMTSTEVDEQPELLLLLMFPDVHLPYAKKLLDRNNGDLDAVVYQLRAQPGYPRSKIPPPSPAAKNKS